MQYSNLQTWGKYGALILQEHPTTVFWKNLLGEAKIAQNFP